MENLEELQGKITWKIALFKDNKYFSILKDLSINNINIWSFQNTVMLRYMKSCCSSFSLGLLFNYILI